MQTETQVATKQNTAVAMPTMMSAMKDAGISASDLIIPKLLLMQNTSEYVGDKLAKLGDIVNSQTMEVIAGEEKPALVVPLMLYKTWRVYDVSQKPPAFVRQDNVTAENAHREWEGVEDGTPMRYDFCYNFFVLLKSELESGEAFPMVISFKRTSMSAGKMMATHMFKRTALGQPTYSQAVPVTVGTEKKEKNTYAVYGLGKGETISKEHQAKCAEWIETLKSVRYTIDEAAEDVTPATSTPTEVVAPSVAPQTHGEEKF